MNSPHLPPKSCNVVWYRRLQSLPGLLVVMALAGLIGAICSLIVVGWIVPTFIPDQSVYTFAPPAQLNQTKANPAVFAHAQERQLFVYDKTKRIGASFYGGDGLLFRAPLLSSDGWAVVYLPAYYYGQEYNWLVADADSKPYKITKTVYNSHTGLLYIKVDGEGFRIFPFFDWKSDGHPSSAWVITDSSAKYEQLSEKLKEKLPRNISLASQVSFLSTKSNYIYTIVVNESGSLVGIGDTDGNIIPSFWMREHISNLLAEEPLGITSLPILGAYVDTVISPPAELGKTRSGFYVVRSYGDIRVGDLIVEIDGNPVNQLLSTYNIFESSDPVPVTVLRKDKLENMELPKRMIR